MRKILWALLPVLVLLGAAGCGAQEAPPETEPPVIEVEVPFEETGAPLRYEGTVLTFQSLWRREDPQSRVLTDAAALFEEQTGAQVKILWPGEYGETSACDILQLSSADFAAMPKENVLDLTEMAAGANYDARSHETLRLQITQQCGYLGAIAQTPYLGGIYYNTEIFSACAIRQTPGSWDEFVALCQTLRNEGWQPLTLDREDTLAAVELHLRCSIGAAEVERLMGKSYRWDTDPAAIAALEQMMLFAKDENLATGTPAEHPLGQNKMATGNSAMMVGTNADCAAVEDAMLTDLNWGIFPYPGNTGSGTWMTADVLVIHSGSEAAQAAFDFVMLLTTGEFDQLRADLSCGIPADPANASPVAGAMDAIRAAQPEPLVYFGQKQLDATAKLWSGWYNKAARCAAALERSK